MITFVTEKFVCNKCQKWKNTSVETVSLETAGALLMCSLSAQNSKQ